MSFISQVISEIIRRFSILIISLFLFIFFFVVGLAIWVFISGSGNDGGEPPVRKNNIEQILSSWKVYRNHDLKFELMHPPSASVTRRREGSLEKIRINFSVIYPGIFHAKYLEISATDEEEGACERETIQFGRKIENVSIHGIDFTKETAVIDNKGQMREITDYYTINQGNCYQLSFIVDFVGKFVFGHDSSNDAYYEQETRAFEIVLSTFGFIDGLEE